MKSIHEETLLITRLQQGSQEAFTHLYHLYWRTLYAMAYNRLRSKETAEELVQDVFAKLWARRKQLVIRKTLEGYLFCALKYEILTYLDKQAIRDRHLQTQQAGSVLSNNTEETLSFEELYQAMEQEVNRLPEKCRLVFTMSRTEAYTLKEIAQKLEISVKTVESHLTKALKTLRINLSQFLSLLILLLLG